jgi:excisionase family DNA binding protein
VFALFVALYVALLPLMARRGARRWASVAEAAKYSGYAIRTIRQRIADGDLPAYIARGSRVLRIDLDDVDDMIAGAGRMPTAHLGDKSQAVG